MAEKTVISFKVSTDIKTALAKLAAADDRSLSAYIDRVLRNHVAATSAPQGGKAVGKRKL